VSDGITQKGEFQLNREGFRSNIEGPFRWLFGLDGPLTRRDWVLATYASWLVALFGVLAIAVVAVRPATDGGSAWPLAALAISALLAEMQSVRLSSRAAVSVSSLPIILAAVIYGPFAAMVVSVASLLCDLRPPYARWLIWTSSRSIAAGCAGAVALEIDGPGGHDLGRVLAAVVCATVIEQVGDLVLGSVAARLRGMTLREIAKVSSAVSLALPLYVPMAALLVYACREVSAWSVVLFLFPAFAAQKFFLLYREQRATSAGHSAAVAVYARDIAKRLSLSEHDQSLVHLAGLVHDIGKIGLPPGLLEKPGPLTLEERVQMEQHSVIGERILARVEGYDEIAQIVRHHHERVDGTGYPDRLRGDQIPLLSRIIAVADAYNAMTSHRPYRDAMPSSMARVRLAQSIDAQFDTAIVAAFEAVLVGADDEYRAGRHGEFEFEFESAPARPRLVAVASA
jgi:putative nucleotidyltransferase with HDIG domain